MLFIETLPEAVFRIRDILIRTWIRGSVPLTNGQDPASFVSDLQDANQKINFSLIFLLITFSRYISITFQRQKVIKSHKTKEQELKVFLIMTSGSGVKTYELFYRSGTLTTRNTF